MITSFRNKRTFILISLWFIVFAFIATIFLVWGMGDKAQQTNIVAKIDGQPISNEEFVNTFNRKRDELRQLLGDAYIKLFDEKKLEKLVFNDIVARRLLLKEAYKRNIPVSDSEVLSYVTSIDAFKRNGKFDKELYHQLLGRNGMIPEQYESSIKASLLMSKLEALVKRSVTVGDLEIQKEYIYRNSKAIVEYIKLEPSFFEPAVKVTDEALKEFYNKNKESYRIPEKIKVKYVELSEDNFKPELKISDADLEKFYIKNKNKYDIQESVTASHILTLVKDWKDEALVAKQKKKLQDVLKKIKAGSDFAEMAKKYSEGPSGAKGGELGKFTKGQMVPEFEKAAFAMKKGEVSDIVKTQFGFHIIKLTDKQEAKKMSFKDVKDTIKEQLTTERKAILYKEHLFALYKEIVKASNITAYNKTAEKKLEVKELPEFSVLDKPALLAAVPGQADRLFKLQKSEISQVITIQGKRYVFELISKTPSFIPEFDKLKGLIKEDYVAAESLKEAEKAASTAVKGGDMEKAAEVLSKSYTTTTAFKKKESIPGIGYNSKLADAIFRAKEGTFLKEAFTVGGKVYLLRLKKKIRPDMKELDKEKEQIRKDIYTIKSDEAFNSFITSLKEKAKIEISPEYKRLSQ